MHASSFSPLTTYGMNPNTQINDILPPLLPRINAANNMPHPVIDVQ